MSAKDPSVWDSSTDALIKDGLFLVAAITRGEIATRAGSDLLGPIGIVNAVAAETRGSITHSQRTALEAALLSLLSAISPATIQSLRDTDPRIPPDGKLLRRLGQYEALAFSRGLWAWSFVFIVLAVAGNWIMAPDGCTADADGTCFADWKAFFRILTPFTYGALGATASLLRILHTYIYDRTFDRRRKPEYYNRVLLGAIAGGVIAMFIAGDTAAPLLTAKLSAGALGFLAGYSTDFLFATIERITAAAFPKVTVSPDRPGFGRVLPANATPPLDELLNRLSAATTEQDRAAIGELINRYYPGGQY